MTQENNLVKRCLKKEAAAYKELYNLYAPRMYAVCLRFARLATEADDILQEGFIRVFNKLNDFKSEGSLEGWIRRVIVTTAINYINRNVSFHDELELDDAERVTIIENEAMSKMTQEELIRLIQELPESKRLILNLYAYEGYSHKEIAQKLGIDESTSKAQLSKAKKILREKLEKLHILNYEKTI